MLFTPNKHELSIMINQIPLHYDQFEEITMYDIFSNMLPSPVYKAIKEYYGWSELTLDKINSEYNDTNSINDTDKLLSYFLLVASDFIKLINDILKLIKRYKE